MKKGGILRRWFGWLAAIAAAVLIVLAALVGIARLLLPLVPQYQADIRQFANEATGLDVQFSRLTASWPIRGPAIRFFDVQVRTRDGRRNVFDADELTVGANLFRLVTERRLLPGRVDVRSARIRVDSVGGGHFLLNGVPLEDLWHPPPAGNLPHIELRLADITVLVVDQSRLVSQAGFRIVTLDAAIAPAGVTFDGRLEPAADLGQKLELAGTIPATLLAGATDQPGNPPDWSVQVSGTGLDLARWFRIILNEPTPLVAGKGDIDLHAELTGFAPRQLDLDVDVADVVLQGSPGEKSGEQAGYRRFGASLGWTRDPDGWHLAVNRLAVQRDKTASPVAHGDVKFTAGVDDKPWMLHATADVVRVADIFPLVVAVASAGLRRDLLPERVAGEVRRLELDASAGASGGARYKVRAMLQDLGFVMPEPGVAVTGVTGKLVADERSGQFALDSRDAMVRLPDIFERDIATTRAEGLLAWRKVGNNVELIAKDLVIATPDGQTRSRLQLTLPPEGSAVIDLTSRIQAASAPAVVTYLPLKKFHQAAADWLKRAIIAGRVPKAELTWQGQVHGFPYAIGDGNFRAEFDVEEGVLDYAPQWPRVEGVSAKVVIDRATLESVENRGTVAGLPFQDAEFRVQDLATNATLEISHAEKAQVRQVLGFLQQSPIATLLGPTLSSITGEGDVAVGIRLTLPIGSPADYRVSGTFAPDRATLGLKGVEFGLTDLTGTLRLEQASISGEGLKARFLDEPVNISIRPARSSEPGLSHVASIDGTTPTEKLTAAFALPFADRLGGTVTWRTEALFPARQGKAPMRLVVESDLRGMVSAIAPPLDKNADAVEPLHLDISFPEPNTLDVEGRVQRGVSWAVRFLSAPKTGWRAERGAFDAGRALAVLPARPGLEITGDFQAIRFENWFTGRGPGKGSGTELLRRVFVGVGRLSIFGQSLPDTEIDAERSNDVWTIKLRGPAAEGRIIVPAGGDADAPIVMEMQRLWLKAGDAGTGDEQSDPRTLPPVRASVQDFIFHNMRLGRLTAEMSQRGDGVIVEPLSMESKSFSIRGDSAWLVENDDPAKQRSELRLAMQSTDIRPTLEALGFDPVVDGEKADVDVDLVWPGGPSDDFLDVAAGRVTVMMRKGQLLSVDPGGGRVLGLLSIAALPRRLGMDFRDVVDKGLAFDQVKGEFRLEGGNAFTCNLGLEGQVADLGMVGRVGFRGRDYDQLAVVRPHVSDVFALGGAVVGGPVIGGAVLLISQIFRKSLSSLGESYYRVSGSWDKPVVTRVQADEVDITPFKDCERYLKDVLREPPAQSVPAPEKKSGP